MILAAYGVLRVMTGSSIPKTAAEIAMLERQRIRNERDEKRSGGKKSAKADVRAAAGGGVLKRAANKAGPLLVRWFLKSQRVV